MCPLSPPQLSFSFSFLKDSTTVTFDGKHEQSKENHHSRKEKLVRADTQLGLLENLEKGLNFFFPAKTDYCLYFDLWNQIQMTLMPSFECY